MAGTQISQSIVPFTDLQESRTFSMPHPKTPVTLLRSISQSRNNDKTPSHTKQEWISMKETIRRLWLVENKPFKNSKRPQDSVQEILKSDHDFFVT
jgi:hypothetical protein